MNNPDVSVSKDASKKVDTSIAVVAVSAEPVKVGVIAETKAFVAEVGSEIAKGAVKGAIAGAIVGAVEGASKAVIHATEVKMEEKKPDAANVAVAPVGKP